ncbi:hypothetical protein TcasGA2_TC010735 [Tribolium castaneum]|uniref:Uncharacterized protein n=1 Tax=Tribolium castaneum TaxID=7070 RepID=D2CG60_TRICA|nr:hypothetical protein TcasGA2_TC010735 [Tribolium castaneum]
MTIHWSSMQKLHEELMVYQYGPDSYFTDDVFWVIYEDYDIPQTNTTAPLTTDIPEFHLQQLCDKYELAQINTTPVVIDNEMLPAWQNQMLDNPTVDQPGPIDLILGAEEEGHILQLGLQKIENNLPGRGINFGQIVSVHQPSAKSPKNISFINPYEEDLSKLPKLAIEEITSSSPRLMTQAVDISNLKIKFHNNGNSNVDSARHTNRGNSRGQRLKRTRSKFRQKQTTARSKNEDFDNNQITTCNLVSQLFPRIFRRGNIHELIPYAHVTNFLQRPEAHDKA